MLLLNLALMLDGQSKVFYSTPSFLSAHVLADVAGIFFFPFLLIFNKFFLLGP